MEVKGQTKIYRKDFDGRPAYSRRIASQEYKDGQKGEWVSDYEAVQFPKDTNLIDGSIVQLEGFEAVYKNRNGEVKRKLVVTKYTLLDAPEHIKKNEPMYEAIRDDDIPF